MRSVDVLLAFPPLLFLLVLIDRRGHRRDGAGARRRGDPAPGIGRIVRTATLEVSARGYVEAAVARGERTAAILRREIAAEHLAPSSPTPACGSPYRS